MKALLLAGLLFAQSTDTPPPPVVTPATVQVTVTATAACQLTDPSLDAVNFLGFAFQRDDTGQVENLLVYQANGALVVCPFDTVNVTETVQ